ncbi:MAG: PEGA domain-containing protein [bacterium]|nr:PEGA domain-containing protein [bacterium]
MTKRVRTLIFWLFTVLFLITAPLVVMYTFGFRYNAATRQIVRTGVLSITTIPRNADIDIDDKRHRMSTPTLVKQLRPRNYKVSLTRDGFIPWEKEIKINTQETTFIESVVLWADSEPELQEARGEVHLINPTKTALASLENSGAWTEVWSEDFQNNTRTLIARFAGSEPKNVAIQWSPDGELLLLSNNDKEILVAHRDGSQTLPLDSILPEGIQEIWWDEGQSRMLVFTTRTRTLRLRPFGEEIETLLSKSVETLISTPSGLYYSEQDTSNTNILFDNGNTTEPIAILPKGTYRFVESKLPYLLLFNEDRERLILLDAAVHDQPILLNVEAETAFWSPTDKRLLYTNGFETHVFSPKANSNLLLTRMSNPILAIAWHPAGSTAILARPDGILAYDLNEDGGFVQTKINEAQNVSQIFIDGKGRTLFFLGIVNGEYGFYRQIIR